MTDSATLSGGSNGAFNGHHEEPAAILGGQAPTIVLNADLSFSSRKIAEQTPAAMRAQFKVAVAVGFLAAQLDTDRDIARAELRSLAESASLTVLQAAQDLLNRHER